ncbi:MAG: SsrA-binding protein, partial [Gammaproteobacteria bacterium]
MSGKKSKSGNDRVIAVNRKARHDYFIESTLEAGLVLEGWEAKSLRAGSAQITEAYVQLRKGEAWLIGSYFTPAKTTASYVQADPRRSRKLLVQRY